MLKPDQSKDNRQSGVSFPHVASRNNARYVDALLKAARREYKRAGATVKVVRVPGAFEIPAVAAKLAACPSPGYAAIVCFGVIFQQVLHRLPVVHAVFVFEQEEHARVRCLGRTHNRGTEAARTALEMGLVCARLTQKKPNGTD